VIDRRASAVCGPVLPGGPDARAGTHASLLPVNARSFAAASRQTGRSGRLRMRREDLGRSEIHGEFKRLKAHEERLRQRRMQLLRRELAITRGAVEALEQELRLL